MKKENGSRGGEHPGTMSCCPRVLIVDDSQIIRKYASELLRRHGYNVVGCAMTGEIGVVMAKKHAPDVVIMDVNMPGMGGIEATRILRMHMPTIAVVGLSSENHETIVRKMLHAGAVAYVLKDDMLDGLPNTLEKIGFRPACPYQTSQIIV